MPAGGNSWPTGSFSWVPTGPAFKAYEELIKNNINDLIIIRFYYVNGPFIRFAFQYNGSDIEYGKNMSIKVLLSCRDAQKSSATRVSAFHDYQQKPVDANQAQKDQQADFGNVVNVQKTEQAEKDGAKIKVKSTAYKDQTAGALAQNAAKNSGDTLLLHNIGTQGGAIQYSPLTWEAKQKSVVLEDPPGPGQEVDVKKRYGYLLGPSIITTFNRKMEFASPTQTKSSTVTQPGNNPQKKGKNEPPPGSQSTALTKAQIEAQKKAKAVQGASGSSVVKGTQYSENTVGPEKQQLLQQEEGVKLQAQMYMCPALVGIKPQDVVFVPSLKLGDNLIEDYKVLAVSYSQQGGVVSVSVEGSRTYGLNKPMTGEAAKKWITKADSLRTLEDWQNYAWVERLQ
jgi:hypothetical protein